MLQDNKTGRTNANANSGGGSGADVGFGCRGAPRDARILPRRMTGNGFSRRSDRSYSMGSTTEMMINDFDDERTLDEEEALEGSEDSHNELSNLQKEGDMPLKELLAKYGYSNRSTDNSESSDQATAMHGSGDDRLVSEKGENEGDEYEDEDEDEEEEEEEDEEAEDDEDEEEDDEGVAAGKIPGDKMFKQLSLREFYVEMIKMDAKRMCIAGGNAPDGLECGNVGDARPEDNGAMIGAVVAAVGSCGEESASRGREAEAIGSNENPSSRSSASAGVGGGGGGGGGGSSRLLRSVSRPQSEEEDDDCDYSPDEEEWKKTIMVGSDYQATIPEGLCKYDDALPYENEDKILWNPSFIPEEEVEEFLERAQLPSVKGAGSACLPIGGHVRDDEQALYLLLQCGYSLEEALRRRRMNVLPPTDSISLWSEEECHNFESGLRTYGKDFHLIQRNKVRTRSVGELVQFYYLWKKTERHDIFTYKARMEKKKYALHPGITDYMDRFLEEQEGVRDRSSSPNVNCLLYGDVKRQRGTGNAIANNHSGEVKSVDTWDGVTTDDSLGDINNVATLTMSGNTATTTTTPMAATTTMTTAMTTTTATTTTTTATTTTNSSGVTSTEASLTALPSSSPTSATGASTTLDSAVGTATSISLGRSGSDAATPTNHNHENSRLHGYSPSPENVLSNLPP